MSNEDFELIAAAIKQSRGHIHNQAEMRIVNRVASYIGEFINDRHPRLAVEAFERLCGSPVD